jgi:hypothetical protein
VVLVPGLPSGSFTQVTGTPITTRVGLSIDIIVAFIIMASFFAFYWCIWRKYNRMGENVEDEEENEDNI